MNIFLILTIVIWATVSIVLIHAGSVIPICYQAYKIGNKSLGRDKVFELIFDIIWPISVLLALMFDTWDYLTDHWQWLRRLIKKRNMR